MTKKVQVRVLESRFGRCTLTFTKTADGVTSITCSKDRYTALRVRYVSAKEGWAGEFHQPGLTEVFLKFRTNLAAYKFLANRHWGVIN